MTEPTVSHLSVPFSTGFAASARADPEKRQAAECHGTSRAATRNFFIICSLPYVSDVPYVGGTVTEHCTE